jgi:hypothetical protein
VFSPSQVPAQEQVLHSIFSPAFDQKDKYKKKKRPPVVDGDDDPEEHQQQTNNTSVDFWSEDAHVNVKKARAKTTQDEEEVDADEERFFSPQSFHDDDEGRSITDHRQETNIPLETILTSEEAANISRIQEVEEEAEEVDAGEVYQEAKEQHESPTANPKNDETPIQTTVVEEVVDEDAGGTSLNFSMSPSSTLQGDRFVPTPQESLNIMDSSNSDTQNHYRSGAASPAQEILQNLSNTSIALETSRLEQQEQFLHKLRQLEEAKQHAEQTIQSLQYQVHTAQYQTQSLWENMRQLEATHEQTRESMQQDLQQTEYKYQQARIMEERLQTQVAALTQQLEQQQQQQNHNPVAQARQEEWNEALKDAHQKLEKMKQTHFEFRKNLERALTENGIKVRIKIDTSSSFAY